MSLHRNAHAVAGRPRPTLPAAEVVRFFFCRVLSAVCITLPPGESSCKLGEGPVESSPGLQPLSLPTFLSIVTRKMSELTAQRSQIVAVGRAAHLRIREYVKHKSTPKAVVDDPHVESATAFGVEKSTILARFRRCAARPTAIVWDTFGIQKCG